MTWCAAARWVRADRSVTPRALRDPRVFVSHPRYPLLMPLAQVAVQETFDAGDDRRAIKPLYAAFFPALLLVLFDVARRHAGTCARARRRRARRRARSRLTDFGGADGAYSDVPLGAFFGGGFLLLLGRYARGRRQLAAAILLGAAVLTKNEGLPFAARGARGGRLPRVLRPRRTERRRRLAAPRGRGGRRPRGGRRALGRGEAAFRSAGTRTTWDGSGRCPSRPRPEPGCRSCRAAVAREMTDRGNLAGFGLAGAVILAAGAGGLRRRIVPADRPLPLLLLRGLRPRAPPYDMAGGVRAASSHVVPPPDPALPAPWRSSRARSPGRMARAIRRDSTATSRGIPAAVLPGRTARPRFPRRALLVFLGFAVLPVVATWLWAAHLRELAKRPTLSRFGGRCRPRRALRGGRTPRSRAVWTSPPKAPRSEASSRCGAGRASPVRIFTSP